MSEIAHIAAIAYPGEERTWVKYYLKSFKILKVCYSLESAEPPYLALKAEANNDKYFRGPKSDTQYHSHCAFSILKHTVHFFLFGFQLDTFIRYTASQSSMLLHPQGNHGLHYSVVNNISHILLSMRC